MSAESFVVDCTVTIWDYPCMVRLFTGLFLCGGLVWGQFTPPAGGGGSVTPGGSSGAVQYNNAGALGGDANHMWYPLAGPTIPSGGGLGLLVNSGTDTEGYAYGSLANFISY